MVAMVKVLFKPLIDWGETYWTWVIQRFILICSGLVSDLSFTVYYEATLGLLIQLRLLMTKAAGEQRPKKATF